MGKSNLSQKSHFTDGQNSNLRMSDSYGTSQAIQSKEYKSGDDQEFNISGEQDGMVSLKHRLLNEKDNFKDMVIAQNNDEDLIEDHQISAYEYVYKKPSGRGRNSSNSVHSDEEPLID